MPGRSASLLGILVPFLFSAYSVSSLSLVVPQLAQAFHATVGQVLIAIPVDFIGGAIGGLVLGNVADRYGRRTALLIAGALFSVFVLVASAATALWEIYLFWFFVGVGVGSQNGVAYPVVVETLSSSTGLVGGLMQGLYFIGFLLDEVTYMFVPHWRNFFLIAGAISLALTMTTTPLVSETVRRGVVRRASLLGMGRELAIATAALSLLTLGALMFSTPLLSVVPAMLQGEGISSSWLVPLSALGFVGFVLAGLASDRAGRAGTALAFSSLGLTASAALAALLQPQYVLTALAAMFFLSGYFSFIGIWASEVYPIEFRATATNLVFLVGRLVGGFSAYIAASIYPHSLRLGTAVTCIIANVLAVAGSLMYIWLYRARTQA